MSAQTLFRRPRAAHDLILAIFAANPLQPLIDFFEWILLWFHDNVGLGWGLSIIAMTVLVRAACCR